MLFVLIVIKDLYADKLSVRAPGHYPTTIMSTKLSRRIKPVVNLLFAVVFIVHFSYILYYIAHPELADIKHYKKDLQDVEFPLSFELCVEELADSNKRYNEVGYSDVWTYFYGMSKFNSSIIGWAGHKEDGSTFGSVKGIETFKIFHLRF